MAAPGTQSRYDCVVIGGGHNGLVCAATLARGGLSVLVLEAGTQVGGAALTREFAPGFRVSAGAHLLHLMPAELMRELQLGSHGLEWAAQRMPTTALEAGGACMTLGDDGAGSGLSTADAQAYSLYRTRMRRFAAALAPVLSRVPPRLGTADWADRLALLRLGWQVRKLGRRDMRELLRIGGMNVFDLLEENFDSASLKGALGFDAILGANFGPRSPGTVLTLLYRLAAESAAGASGLSAPKGGMGALCNALAKAASAAGAAIRTGAPVAAILVEGDCAAGVALESGERISARCVVSSADPKTTFLRLLGPRHLDAGFVRRVKHIRSRGLAAKLHLALNRAPSFLGVSEANLRGRLLIAPSLQHIEHAYNHAKYGEFSAAPIMEITVPTVNDPALAPPGQHVLSAIVQYAPYALKEEQEFRISGGHWHHADLAFDQFLMVRPVPGAAQHRTPMDGLFLCGAGCHPGGGVMGIAGRNAAQQVLKTGLKSP
jgi:phytoene dehydrogenase-like protein